MSTTGDLRALLLRLDGGSYGDEPAPNSPRFGRRGLRPRSTAYGASRSTEFG